MLVFVKKMRGSAYILCICSTLYTTCTAEYFNHFRSSYPEVFYKKAVLKNVIKFVETPAMPVFIIKLLVSIVFAFL